MKKYYFLVLIFLFLISCSDSVSFFYNGEKAESSIYEITIEKNTVFNIFSFLSARGEDEKDLTGKIELISGYLDTGTAGRYPLKYRIAYKRTVKEIEIVIFVRDDPVFPTSALPVIQPKGDNPLSVPGGLSSDIFIDPGASVIDSNGRLMPDNFLSKTAYYFDLEQNEFVEVKTVLSKGYGVYRIDYNGFDYSGKAAQTVSRLVFYGNRSVRSVEIELNRYPFGDLLPGTAADDAVLSVEAGVGKTYRECGGTVKFIENGVLRTETWSGDISSVSGLHRTKIPSFDVPGTKSVCYWYSKDGTAAAIEAFTCRTLMLVDKQPPVLTLGNPSADAPLPAALTWQEAFDAAPENTYELNAGQKFAEPADAGKRFPRIDDNCDKDLLWSRVQTSFFRYNEDNNEIESISLFPDPAARRGDVYFIRYSAADRSGNLCHYWRKVVMKSGAPARLKFYIKGKETKSVVYGYYSRSAEKSFLPTPEGVDGNGEALPESDYRIEIRGTRLNDGTPVTVPYYGGKDLEARLTEAGILDMTAPGQYPLDFAVIYDGLESVVKRYVSVFNYDGITVLSDKSDDDFSGEKYTLRWQHTQKDKGYSNAMILYRSDYRNGKEWERVGPVNENEFITVPYGISFYKLVPARISEDGEVTASPEDAPETEIIQLCRDFPAVENFTASVRDYSDRIELNWKPTENADYYQIYSSRDSSFASLENLLAEVRNGYSYTVWEGRPLKTAYMWYFQIRPVTEKSGRGWKTDPSDVRGNLIYSVATAKAGGMRELSDSEWLRDVLIEIGGLQSRFNLGDDSFGEGGKVPIGGGGAAFYYRVWNADWPENDWPTKNRSTLLDYFHFNGDGRRLKISGGIAYLYLFTKSKKDYYVGITAKADSVSFPEKLKRQSAITVKGDYPGTVDIHALLDNCWDRAASNSDTPVQNSAGESFLFRGNRWIADCDGRTSVGHSCPSYRFYQQDWCDILGFYENGHATFSHRTKMFLYTRDGGTEKTHGIIIVP